MLSVKLNKPKTTQYVSHWMSSWCPGDSSALNERKAGTAHPMRLDTGPARELTKWKRVRRRTAPRTAYDLGIWVRCSNVFRTGYFVSCGTGMIGVSKGVWGRRERWY